jgi:hypothetical protein
MSATVLHSGVWRYIQDTTGDCVRLAFANQGYIGKTAVDAAATLNRG